MAYLALHEAVTQLCQVVNELQLHLICLVLGLRDEEAHDSSHERSDQSSRASHTSLHRHFVAACGFYKCAN